MFCFSSRDKSRNVRLCSAPLNIITRSSLHRCISSDLLYCFCFFYKANRRNFADKPSPKNSTTAVIQKLNSLRSHRRTMPRPRSACLFPRPLRDYRLAIDGKPLRPVRTSSCKPKRVPSYALVRRLPIHIESSCIETRTIRRYEPTVSACASSADKNAKIAAWVRCTSFSLSSILSRSSRLFCDEYFNRRSSRRARQHRSGRSNS